jgi:hypothetical protein
LQQVLLTRGKLQDVVGSAVVDALFPELEGDLSAWIEPSRALSSEARVAIYRDMIWIRFRETMESDFATLLRLAGAETFTSLVHGYLVEHPSRGWTLNRLGERFPAWLRDRADLPETLWSDLAELEWAVQDVYQAVDEKPLDLEDMQREGTGEGTGEVGDLPLRLARAVRILDQRAPLVSLCLAVEKDPEVRPALPSLEPSHALVHRGKDGLVYRAQIEPVQAHLLRQFTERCSLAAALEATFETHPEPTWLEQVQDCFTHWSAAGMFVTPLSVRD